MLHKTVLAPSLMYGSATKIWKEKEISRIKAIHMDILRVFFLESAKCIGKRTVRNGEGMDEEG